MTERTILSIKIKRIDETIDYYENQLEATGQKLVELRQDRQQLVSRLEELQRKQAVDDGGVYREELNREPDGDLVWA